MSADQTDQVTIVLVNYNSGADVTDRVIDLAPAGHRIIVVDNASEPDLVAKLGEEFGVVTILSDTNRGFAGGVNLALRSDAYMSKPGPVLLLNPDVIVAPQEVDRLLRKLRETGASGASPLLREPSGRLQVGVGGAPITVRSVVIYFLFLSHLVTGWRGLFLTRSQSREGGEVAWLCAACLLISQVAVARFGAWPEDEIVYAEDVAWGTAATAAGARFYLNADMEVEHRVGGSGGSDAWIGSLKRLCVRRMGPFRGGLAAISIDLGLWLRKQLGRKVT